MTEVDPPPGAAEQAAQWLAASREARDAGDLDARREALLQSVTAAREAGDPALLAEVALELPTGLAFGVHPGQVPGLLHEALVAADGLPPGVRARLAAALARAWVYGGEAARAVPFADQAEQLSNEAQDPAVVADALDAGLLVHWGPGDLAVRRQLAARLTDVAAHLMDPEVRLSAFLWRLMTAWESLDVVAVQRQLRALDDLADETGSTRVAFYAASRRAMHALVLGDLDGASRWMVRTEELGARSAEPDVEAVVHSLRADHARQAGDREALAQEAMSFEQYGSHEGIASVIAEAAVFWLDAGRPDRATTLVLQLAGDGLAALSRDVDLLLTVTCIAEVSSALGMDDVSADAALLLEPYSGRAVLNAGAVTFHGVVDDALFRLHRSLGDDGATRWRDIAVSAYRRLGAPWWEARLGAVVARDATDATDATDPAVPVGGPGTTPDRVAGVPRWYLARSDAGLWTVGPEGSTVVLADRRGLAHLRTLLSRPGIEVPALELVEAAAGHAGSGVHQGDVGPMLDDQARRAYRRRLRELDAEIDEATEWSDPERRDRAEAERDALVAELGAASGLGGRSRRRGANDERARVTVRKAITSALDAVDGADPVLARLLRDTVRTGTSCCYQPDPARPVHWVLDPGDGGAATSPVRGRSG